jgi:hypothetical protein
MKRRPVKKKIVETQTGTGSAFPEPEPMELAKLAAILRPGSRPADALRVAREWYFEAVLCVSDGLKKFEPLFKKKRIEESHAKWRKKLNKLQAASWADAVDLDEARRLLADPPALAEALKLPRKEEQPPPGVASIKPLRELPGVTLKSDAGVRKNVLAAMEWKRRTLRIKDDGYASGRSFEEMFEVSKGVCKIPKFILEWVLRYRYERAKDAKRKSWHRDSGQKQRQNLSKKI